METSGGRDFPESPEGLPGPWRGEIWRDAPGTCDLTSALREGRIRGISFGEVGVGGHCFHSVRVSVFFTRKDCLAGRRERPPPTFSFEQALKWRQSSSST